MCSTIKDQKTCEQDKCHFNLPVAIVPSVAVDVCTHSTTDVQNTEQINKCMNEKSSSSCNAPCVWNMPKVIKPSTYPNTCTHSDSDVQNTAQIQMCSTIKSQKTCQEDNCKWNYFEAPTFVPMTCTHKTAQSSDVSQVGLCKGLKDMNVCAQDGCQWNPCKRPAGQDLAPPSDMKCPMGAPYFDDYTCGF
jgi:hypothetical protein